MAKRIKTSNNYLVIEDTISNSEDLRILKESVFFKKINDGIHFYLKENGRIISVEIYTIHNSINGNDSDASFNSIQDIVSFLESNTGLDTSKYLY